MRRRFYESSHGLLTYDIRSHAVICEDSLIFFNVYELDPGLFNAPCNEITSEECLRIEDSFLSLQLRIREDIRADVRCRRLADPLLVWVWR